MLSKVMQTDYYQKHYSTYLEDMKKNLPDLHPFEEVTITYALGMEDSMHCEDCKHLQASGTSKGLNTTTTAYCCLDSRLDVNSVTSCSKYTYDETSAT